MPVALTHRLSLLGALAAAPACAVDVTSTADSGPGSLRAAIETVNLDGGGVISFADPFPLEGVIVLASPLPTVTAATLDVRGGDRVPRIDGDDQHHLFRLATGNTQLSLSDLVLRRGRGGSDLGACVHGPDGSSGDLVVVRVEFHQCVTEQTGLAWGGAIRWGRTGGSAIVSDALFSQNAVIATGTNAQSAGGAIYALTDLSVIRSHFVGNSASAPNGGNAYSAGGAIAAGGPNTDVRESRFALNSTYPSGGFGDGGAIRIACGDCYAQVGRSSFDANAAVRGGAIAVRQDAPGAGPFLSLANTSFVDNSSGGNGGALYLESSALSAQNSTFYRNDATAGAHLWLSFGSAIEVFRANLLAPPFAGTACGFAATPVPQLVVGHNYLADASCAELSNAALPAGPLGTIDYDETPGLIPVLSFSGSGVIDSIASVGNCDGTDARGNARPIDGDDDGEARCDVGAFEHPGAAIFASGFEP